MFRYVGLNWNRPTSRYFSPSFTLHHAQQVNKVLKPDLNFPPTLLFLCELYLTFNFHSTVLLFTSNAKL